MRKLLLVLLFLPLVSFGQTKEELQLCLAAQSSSFTSDSEADNALDRILNVIGASKNFVLTPCSEINNAMATSYKGIRYILYDKAFMKLINSRTNDWASLAILAHEVGHHINGHTLDLTMYAGGVVEAKSLAIKRKQELEADEFAGFILARLGATSDEALAFTKVFQEKDDTYDTHPTKSKRVASVTKGYTKAAGNSKNNDYVVNNSTISVEEYFNRGIEKYKSEDYYGAISDFTYAIELKPDYADAYLYMGMAKNELNDFGGALLDTAESIELNPELGFAHYIRGRLLLDLGEYDASIEHSNKAIKLSPSNHFNYFERGKAKSALGDNYGAIADYTKAIELKPDNVDAYANRGGVKVGLGDINGGCVDWRKAKNLGANYITEWIKIECN